MKLRSKETDALKMLARLANLCLKGRDVTQVDLRKMYFYLNIVKNAVDPVKIREEDQ